MLNCAWLEAPLKIAIRPKMQVQDFMVETGCELTVTLLYPT
jgi:hypothetical protein